MLLFHVNDFKLRKDVEQYEQHATKNENMLQGLLMLSVFLLIGR